MEAPATAANLPVTAVNSEANSSRVELPGVDEKAPPSPAVDDNGQTEDTKEKKKDDSSFKYFMRVFTYNDRQGWVLNIIATICSIASGTALPLMDIVFGKFVNVFNQFAAGELSPAGYRSEVTKYTLFFIYLFVGKFVLTYIWTLLLSVTAVRATKNLRVDFIRQTLRQEVSFFDTPSSSVSGQLTTNGNLINNGISEKFGLTIQAIASFVAAFVVAFAVQWKLTLIIISIVPVNIVVTVICVIYDTSYEYAMFDIYSQSSSLAEEAFATIRNVHAFWAFPKLSKRFTNILEDARKVGNKKSIVYAILFPVEFFCIFSGYGLAFWQGVRMYASGEIPEPGTVVTVVFAVLVAAQALTQIAPQTIAISKATAAAQEMFAIIDRKSEIDSLSDEGIKIPDFKGDIKLRNVRFTYPARPDVQVLHGLDLDIPANKSTALVGASGSGKSTIFGLLERWYLPHQGSSITLDGYPIEDLNLQWLRTHIRLVQQEPTLFSGTIFDNVMYGLEGTEMTSLSLQEKTKLVKEACQAAYAHDFIEALPKGYETWIGERGASLSGGQKQRIVIARSIISNPKVLLLDEATSALDPNAEKIVQQALNNVAKGRTMITIAHRLSTIQDADNIIVMSKGELIEQGTHSELINLQGSYARLVKVQDLGHKSIAKTEDEEKDMPITDMEKLATAASNTQIQGSVVSDEIIDYNLFQGLYYIFKEQRSIWAISALLLVACAAGGVTFPALAVLFARTMEAFVDADVNKGDFFALMFFVVALGNLVAYAFAGWFANVIAQHVMIIYRGEIFDNTLRQDMVFFDNPENGTGALVSRLSSEPTSLQELVSMNIALLLINIINILSSSILAIVTGWKLGLVLCLGALPVVVGAGYLRIRLEFKFDDDTVKLFATSSGMASESVMAIRTVSSLALERAVVEKYHNSLDGIAQTAMKSSAWKMLFYSLSQSLSFLAMALGFWYGGRLVSTGEYDNGQFYTVFIAVVFSAEATAQFFQYTTSITKARTAINYIFQLRKDRVLNDLSDGNAGSPNVQNPLEKGTEIACQEIGFSYPLRPNLKVLRGIDVDIGSGKMVAFVGASGCGKSTMIALLERFYDPTTGRIEADGHDIRTQDRRRYRQDVALVQQEPVLYQGSIRENVLLGLEQGEGTDEQIQQACRNANIWDFISSLPEGLATPCGNQGLSLSGGQRQRIAIARALIRQPRLLLLDEATSALDTESEKVVKEALDRAAEGRTTIAVAHRLSTIRDADTIVVFEGGRVVQMGTHEELIAKRGLYYEMVLGQSLDQEAA
ncbi:ABC multidrug transporter MDR5 [Paramyrothecium foliicola]|nr:ABC multidrug transporter MDR5 [Paramyrothecium foliicola]